MAEKQYLNVFIQEGGMDMLFHLSKNKDTVIDNYIFNALKTLSCHDVIRIQLLSNEWLSVFNNYTNNNVIMLTPSNIPLLQNIMYCFSNILQSQDLSTLQKFLTYNENNKDYIYPINILVDFNNILYPPDSIVTCKSILANTIKGIAMHQTQIKEPILKNSILFDLIYCMCKSKLEPIQIIMGQTLTELSKQEESRIEIVGNNELFDCLLQWTRSNNKEVRYHTSAILNQLLQDDKIAVIIVRTYGVQFLMNLADVPDIDVVHNVEHILSLLKRQFKSTKEFNSNYYSFLCMSDDFNINYSNVK